MRTPFKRSQSGLGDLFGLALGGSNRVEDSAYTDTQGKLSTIALNQARRGKVASEAAINEAQLQHQQNSLGEEAVAALAARLGLPPEQALGSLHRLYGTGSNVAQFGQGEQSLSDIARRETASAVYPTDPGRARFEAELSGRRVDRPYSTSGGVVLNTDTGGAEDLRPYSASGGTLVHRGTGEASAAPRTFSPRAGATTARGEYMAPSALQNLFSRENDDFEEVFDQSAYNEYARWAEQQQLSVNKWDTYQKYQAALGGVAAPGGGVQTTTDRARLDPTGADPLGILN